MKKGFISLAIVALSLAAFAQSGVLTPEKLWQLGRVSLDAVSPDGQTAVYGVTYYNIEANKGNRDLYIVPVAGGTSKKITAFDGGENSAQFTPDGKRIGFLRGSLLWEMNADGSDQHKVSDEEMNGFQYSPDGKSILFIRDVKMDKSAQDQYPDLPKANARVIDDLMYRHWDSWHDFSYSNIFVAAYTNGTIEGTPANIMNEPYDSPLQPFGGMEQISWSPDGKWIAYTCKKLSGKEYAESTNSDIYLYELSTRKTTNLTEGMNGYDQEPAWSNDGRYLAWNSMATPGFESDRNRIFVYDFQTKKKEEVTVGYDNPAEHPQWSPDGKSIFCISIVKGTEQLYVVDVATKKIKPVTEGRHDFSAFGVAGPETLVGQRMSMSEPAELFRVDVKSGKMTQLTFTNKAQLDQIKMGKVEERHVKTTDDKDMLAWVIYPPNFDPKKKYPTLLYCQGGPQSPVSQFFSYRWNFQLMAANGYIVVAPNRRGLPGFGSEWNNQISGDWGGQAMKDLLSAIDDVKLDPWVDAGHLGAVGASFGGYSVFWLAGNHDKRFKAFIAHDGVFNFESFYGTTEEMFFANHDLGGPYWGKNPPEGYKKFSPHLFVDKWDTPIMIVQGEQDFRVPVAEGLQAFQAAQLKGIPSKLLYLPDEGHWVLSPQDGLLWQRVFFGWLDQYLKEQP